MAIKATQMDRGKAVEKETGDVVSNPTLPDVLVEKIIGKVPYPQILTARALSRSWFARFQSVSVLKDADQQLLAVGFQKKVLEESKNWDVFWPICTSDDPVGIYNQAERKWQRLVSRLVFREEEEENQWNIVTDPRRIFWKSEGRNLQYEGPFLYGAWPEPGTQPAASHLHILVCNVVTGIFKRLNPDPYVSFGSVRGMKLVIDSSAETYKVIVLSHRRNNSSENCYHQCLRIYDSKSRSWSSNESPHVNMLENIFSGFAYLNGVFYTLYSMNHLLAFNVETGTLEHMSLSVPFFRRYAQDLLHNEAEDRRVHPQVHPGDNPLDGSRLYFGNLVVCNGNLLAITTWSTKHQSMSVWKIDLVKLDMSLVGRRDDTRKLDVVNAREMINYLLREPNYLVWRTTPERVDDTTDDPERDRIAVLNISKDQWMFFSFPMKGYLWSDCCFRPGLNPFMRV